MTADVPDRCPERSGGTLIAVTHAILLVACPTARSFEPSLSVSGSGARSKRTARTVSQRLADDDAPRGPPDQPSRGKPPLTARSFLHTPSGAQSTPRGPVRPARVADLRSARLPLLRLPGPRRSRARPSRATAPPTAGTYFTNCIACCARRRFTARSRRRLHAARRRTRPWGRWSAREHTSTCPTAPGPPGSRPRESARYKQECAGMGPRAACDTEREQAVAARWRRDLPRGVVAETRSPGSSPGLGVGASRPESGSRAWVVGRIASRSHSWCASRARERDSW
jgi:hypothetical protein